MVVLQSNGNEKGGKNRARCIGVKGADHRLKIEDALQIATYKKPNMRDCRDFEKKNETNSAGN